MLVLGRSVAWGSDFEEAARNLLAKVGDDVSGGTQGEDADAEAGDDAAADDDGGSGTSAADFAGLDRAELEALLGDVATAYDAALACQKRGDWACYGRARRRRSSRRSRRVDRTSQLNRDSRCRTSDVSSSGAPVAAWTISALVIEEPCA